MRQRGGRWGLPDHKGWSDDGCEVSNPHNVVVQPGLAVGERGDNRHRVWPGRVATDRSPLVAQMPAVFPTTSARGECSCWREQGFQSRRGPSRHRHNCGSTDNGPSHSFAAMAFHLAKRRPRLSIDSVWCS